MNNCREQMIKKTIVMMSLLLLNFGHVELMASGKFGLKDGVKNQPQSLVKPAAVNSGGLFFIDHNTMQCIGRSALLFAANESINYGINSVQPDASATTEMYTKIALGATLMASAWYLKSRQKQAFEVLHAESQNIKDEDFNKKNNAIINAEHVADFMQDLSWCIAMSSVIDMVAGFAITKRVFGTPLTSYKFTFADRSLLFGLQEVAMPVAVDALKATGFEKQNACNYVHAAAIVTSTVILNSPDVVMLPSNRSVAVISNDVRTSAICIAVVIPLYQYLLQYWLQFIEELNEKNE